MRAILNSFTQSDVEMRFDDTFDLVTFFALAKSLTILMPYFPTGTMERIDEEGQIATAMTFARILSAVPLTAHGPSKLVIYDIHALQNRYTNPFFFSYFCIQIYIITYPKNHPTKKRFYFGDSVIPVLLSAIPIFISTLKTHHKNEKIAIAFPDEGATKRFGKKFAEEGWPVVTCTKIRQGPKRIVSIKEGEEYVKGYHVFVVDDLCKTGGTLKETRAVLAERGATKVSA